MVGDTVLPVKGSSVLHLAVYVGYYSLPCIFLHAWNQPRVPSKLRTKTLSPSAGGGAHPTSREQAASKQQQQQRCAFICLQAPRRTCVADVTVRAGIAAEGAGFVFTVRRAFCEVDEAD